MNLYDCKILLVDDEKALREMVCGFCGTRVFVM